MLSETIIKHFNPQAEILLGFDTIIFGLKICVICQGELLWLEK